MRQLETLIKMHKLYVDQQRRVLAERQSEADAIMMAIATLQANMEMEKEKALDTQEGSLLIGAYIKDQLKRHVKLQRDLSAKEREVNAEREKLSLMFEELKRYEIAQETRDEEERKLASKREDQGYDEQSSQRHHQREE